MPDSTIIRLVCLLHRCGWSDWKISKLLSNYISLDEIKGLTKELL